MNPDRVSRSIHKDGQIALQEIRCPGRPHLEIRYEPLLLRLPVFMSQLQFFMTKYGLSLYYVYIHTFSISLKKWSLQASLACKHHTSIFIELLSNFPIFDSILLNFSGSNQVCRFNATPTIFGLTQFFLIQFYSTFMIQFNGIFQFDLTTITYIWFTIYDSNQFLLKFELKLPQLSFLIQHTLHSCDSPFLICFRNSHSIWLSIAHLILLSFLIWSDRH